MSEKKLQFQMINNSSVFLAGELIYRILSFVTALWVVRSLGQEEYGQFSFVYVYLSFFEVFVQFGLNATVTREAAHPDAPIGKILGNSILFRIMLCAAGLPLALGVLKLLHYPLTVEQGVFLAYFQLFLTIRAIYDAYFKVHLKMIVPAAANTIKAVLSFVLIVIAAYKKADMQSFILAYLISGVITFAGFALFSRKYIKLDFRWDGALMSRLIKDSVPLMLSGYLTILYYRVDVFMLSKMKGFTDVGYYSVATRLTEALGVIATALYVSVFPVLARSFQNDRPLFDKTIRKAFRVMLLAGLPLAAGGTIVARELTMLLFGEAYAPSAPTLSILLWYTFFFFQGGLLANILIACKKQTIDAWVSFSLLIFNVVLNYFLIPQFSHRGAAMATVAVEVAGVLLILIYAVRSAEIKMQMPWKEYRTAVIVNILFAAPVFYIHRLCGTNPFITIPAGILIYAVVLMLFKQISFADIRSHLHLYRGDKK